MGQTKKSNIFFSLMVSLILASSYHIDVCPSLNFLTTPAPSPWSLLRWQMHKMAALVSRMFLDSGRRWRHVVHLYIQSMIRTNAKDKQGERCLVYQHFMEDNVKWECLCCVVTTGGPDCVCLSPWNEAADVFAAASPALLCFLGTWLQEQRESFLQLLNQYRGEGQETQRLSIRLSLAGIFSFGSK